MFCSSRAQVSIFIYIKPLTLRKDITICNLFLDDTLIFLKQSSIQSRIYFYSDTTEKWLQLKRCVFIAQAEQKV